MTVIPVRTLNTHLNAGTRYQPGQAYLASPEALAWLERGQLAMREEAFTSLWESPTGRILSPKELRAHYKAAPASERSLRVLQLTHYDPGASAYRYHSALNASGAALSAFVRWGHSNPHCDLRQWDGDEERFAAEMLFLSADVILCHIDYRTMMQELQRFPLKHQRLVRLYHGSVEPPMRPQLVENEKDDTYEAVQIGARLYHRRLSSRMHWLPIPMPIKDYRTKKPRVSHVFRVAHSPTRREIKGTDIFLAAIESLRAEGHRIEAVLIENLSHGEAIQLKQTCHATFDSFWLGMQGSGLEAACMQQLVIAGDPAVKSENERILGQCPYTYANDAEALRVILTKAMTDPMWRAAEAARSHAYVQQYHSYDAVGAAFTAIAEKEEFRVPANRS